MTRIQLLIVNAILVSSLGAQEWRLRQEITFRVQVRRPGCMAVLNNGDLVIVDNHDCTLHIIDANTGAERIIVSPSPGWKSVADLFVEAEGDLLLCDGHQSIIWRLDPHMYVIGQFFWKLPPRHYLSQILTADSNSVAVAVRQTSVGQPGSRPIMIRAQNRAGRILFQQEGFDGGDVFRLRIAAHQDTLGYVPGSLTDLWTAHPGRHVFFHFHAQTGLVDCKNEEGRVNYSFDTGSRPGPATAMTKAHTRQQLGRIADQIALPEKWTSARCLWLDGMGRLWLATGSMTLSRGQWFEDVHLFDVAGISMGTLRLSFEPGAFFMDRVFTCRSDDVRGQTVVRRYQIIPGDVHIRQK